MTNTITHAAQEAFITAIKEGDVSAVQQLIAHDPTLVDVQDDGQVSAVMLATYYGHSAVADSLVASGAQLDVFAAAALGKTDRLQSMLDADTSLVEAYSGDGWTPLHLAAYFGHKSAAEVIIAHGADPNAKSTNGLQNMALHSAVSNDNVELATLLLMHGAEVNVRQQEGWTPLHGAAHNGSVAMLTLLLNHGADPCAKKDDGATPQAIAHAAGHTAIADVLAEREKTA